MNIEHGLRPKVNADIDPTKKPPKSPPRGITIELDIDDSKAREKLQALEQDLICEHDYEIFRNDKIFMRESGPRLTVGMYCKRCGDVLIKHVDLDG